MPPFRHRGATERRARHPWPRRRSCLAALAAASWIASGCAGGTGGGPAREALALRDLLALTPETVAAMSADDRTYWRHRVDAALDEQAAASEEEWALDEGSLVAAPGVAMALPRSLRMVLDVDRARLERGSEPLVAPEVSPDAGARLRALPAASLFESPAPRDPSEPRLILAGAWPAAVAPEAPELDAVRAALATVEPAGREVRLLPAPGMPFALLWAAADGEAYLNPVVLALRDDAARLFAPPSAAGARPGPVRPSGRIDPTSYWGERNPYYFYSSIAACVESEQARCAACAAGSAADCRAKLGGADGAAECAALASIVDASGAVIGYDLACLAYALSINRVAECVAASNGACVPPAPEIDLARLEDYRPIRENPECVPLVDGCISSETASAGCRSTTCECNDPCNDPFAGCTESCNSCSTQCTECQNDCTCAADQCSECSSCYDSNCSSCAVAARTLPPPPPPRRGPRSRSSVLLGLETAAAALLPPFLFLSWRRRLSGRAARPPAGPPEGQVSA